MHVGIANFRQFGGYHSRHGGGVVKDLLFRSGELSHATEAGRAMLIGIDFALVADLRYPSERLHQPSPWPESWAGRVVSHNQDRALEAPHIALLRTPGIPVSAVDEFYAEFYDTLPLREPYMSLFGKLLQRIAQTNGPILVHCSAGKDRTGIFVALLHAILRVSQDDMMDDYLQSLDAPGLSDSGPDLVAWVERRYGHRPSLELVHRLLAVKRQYLDRMFISIDAHHGSLDAYLTEIGVTDAVQTEIRKRFLLE